MRVTSVHPIRVRDYNRELETNVVRIVAYRAECNCGWRGPGRETVWDARRDSAIHVCEVAS